MSIKSFANDIANEIKAEFPGTEITVREIPKNGEVLTGLTFVSEEKSMGPTLYVNDYYDDFIDGRSLEEIAEMITDVAKDAIDRAPEVHLPDFMNWNEMQDQVVARIVGNEGNEQYLADKVSTKDEFLPDISYVYGVYVDVGDDTGFVSISNTIFDKWNIDKETLHEVAMENTFDKQQPEIKSMQEIMAEMMGMDVEDMPMMPGMDENFPPMIVVSNESKSFGAVSIFHPEVQEELADRIGGDFYILPSSLHEVIVVPADPERLEEFKFMVSTINQEQVAPQERLSDQVYAYDSKNQELCLAEKLSGEKKLTFSMDSLKVDLENKQKAEAGKDAPGKDHSNDHSRT